METVGIGFGISIPLIFLALAVDDVRGLLRKAAGLVSGCFSPNSPSPDQTADDNPAPATGGGPWTMLTRRPTRFDKEQRQQSPTPRARSGAAAGGAGYGRHGGGADDFSDYYDGLSRSSGGRERDLSPLSDRTHRSSHGGRRISWARGSFDAQRLAV